MSLDDACCDFVSLIATKKKSPTQGACDLVEHVEFYARKPYYNGYYKELIVALRRGAKRVIDRPDDQDALLWLLMIADHWYLYCDKDDGRNIVERWCARWLKELQQFTSSSQARDPD